MKAATKNKQSTSFADLIADSELAQSVISVGDHSVTVREMTGRERFELASKQDEGHWDSMVWLSFTCLVDPRPDSIEEMEKLKTEWVVKMANEVLRISGMEEDAEEDAENESANGIDIGGS